MTSRKSATRSNATTLHDTAGMRAFFVLMICLSLAACSGTAPLSGTWVLLDEDIQPDRPAPQLSIEDLEGRQTKVLNDDHFAFGAQLPSGEPWSGGGTYSYQDGEYVEVIEYHSMPELVGKRIVFRCERKGDLWYHEGYVVAGGRKLHIRETWLRWHK